jgi:alkyl sulfatase BDS1-like metallo-beta-lactamase superfamily hydrolase
MRGHLAQARSLLEQLITAEPQNAEAQDLRATVIAQQAALSETALF